MLLVDAAAAATATAITSTILQAQEPPQLKAKVMEAE